MKEPPRLTDRDLAPISERALYDGEDECAPWREVVRREDALFWTGEGPWPWASGVGWVRWSEADLERRVDEMLAFFRERKKPVSWIVGPSSEPVGLIEALRRRRLAEHVPHLLAATLPLPVELRSNPRVDVREVTDEAQMRAAIDIEFPGWDDARRARALFERMAVLRCPTRRSGALLAYLDGAAVGYSAWRVASDRQALQLIGGVVRPEHRDQHVYTTLLAARMAKAQQLDLRVVVVGGADPTTSGPILVRYGFTDLGAIRIFRMPTTGS